MWQVPGVQPVCTCLPLVAGGCGTGMAISGLQRICAGTPCTYRQGRLQGACKGPFAPLLEHYWRPVCHACIFRFLEFTRLDPVPVSRPTGGPTGSEYDLDLDRSARPRRPWVQHFSSSFPPRLTLRCGRDCAVLAAPAGAGCRIKYRHLQGAKCVYPAPLEATRLWVGS